MARPTRDEFATDVGGSVEEEAAQEEAARTLVTGTNPDDSPWALPVELAESGAFAYEAGVEGQVNLPSTGAVVREVSCVAGPAGGSLVIDGGDAIPIPADRPLEIHPNAELNILDFAGTVSYYVQYVG